MQNTYKVIREILSKCLCSLIVQFLSANKYNPVTSGQIKPITENISPWMAMILNDTLINKMREVITLKVRNKKQRDRCEGND